MMRPPLTRRRLLAAAGAALPVGGCLGAPSDPATATDATTPGTTTGSRTDGTATVDADEPLTRTPGESYATADGWSLTVEDVAVRHGVVKFGAVHPDPIWQSGSQFVVADAVVNGDDAPDPADLNLFVRTDTLDRSDRYYVWAPDAGDRRQRFGFPVPTDPAPSRAWVVWSPEEGPIVRWIPDDDSVRRLGAAPEFAVESFEVPATAVPESEFEATVVVRNDGERDGTFLAEVGNAAISDQPEVEFDVPVGERVTGTASVSAYFGDREEMAVVLRWEGGTERRTVRRA